MSQFKFGAAIFSALVCSTIGNAIAADTSPKPATNNSLSIEFGPEYKTTDQSLADDYVKFALAHTFDNNVVLGASFAYQWRPDSTSVNKAEASLGYKIKSGSFTLTPTATLGYGFGDEPKINPANGHAGDAEAYYAIGIAADWKLDDHWTWNVINARYRNAFDVTWITPKVATGVTFKIDGSNAIHASVGYAWKNNGNGAGLVGDKWNVAVGYKLSF